VLPGAPPSRRSVPVAVHLVAAAALLVVSCTGGSGSNRSSGSPAVPGGAPTVRLRVASAGFALPAPVQRAVAVADGGRILIAGGLSAAGTSVNGVFALDPGSGTVRPVGVVPQAFHDATGQVLGGKLFVFGGGTGQSSASVQTLDPATGHGAVASHLPSALSDLASGVVGGTVYLVGGYDGTAPRPEIYATGDGARFAKVGELPEGLRYAAVASNGSSLFIAGGVGAGGPVDTVYRFDPKDRTVALVGHLPQPVGHAAAFALGGDVYVAGGLDTGGHAVAGAARIDPVVGTVTAVAPLPRAVSDAAVVSTAREAWLIGGWRAASLTQVLTATLTVVSSAPVPPTPSSSGSAASATDLGARPFAGLLVVADRGNDRILVLDAQKRIVWTYPSPTLPRPPGRFYFPDDAFWVHGGHAILINEEENDTLIEIAYPSGQVIWRFGHQGVGGSAPGYLHQPDDVYPLPTGGVVVADAKNCRIMFFGADGQPSGQIGTTGVCVHGLPATVGYPNGDTPLPNGHLLLSELDGGTIDEVTRDGHVVWSHRIPGLTHNPSDPQPVGDGTFVSCSYTTPGNVVRFDASGKVLWSYGPMGGPGELRNPSLAAPLPNGLIAVTDDDDHRVVLIDPATNGIVWQYGVTGVPGSANGSLRYPDGLDLLLPGGIAPLHVDFPTTAVVPGRP
jgi:hypothetical protein